MESWRTVWRNGFAPGLTRWQLERLRTALIDDDDRLKQGQTTSPPPLQCVQDWPCEGACLIAFAGWEGGALTVGEVEEFFARQCFEADKRLGEPGGCRWFLNWFDETPRDMMRLELIGEIDRILGTRQATPAATIPDPVTVAVPF